MISDAFRFTKNSCAIENAFEVTQYNATADDIEKDIKNTKIGNTYLIWNVRLRVNSSLNEETFCDVSTEGSER